ncbi:hypothetical protein [Actinocatenispora rupis]|uniref:Methyltransferase n=1 Tax=Actinocatenispora rupis TaxID=519421 RepID=A0A8J3NBU6_9ACTN|nr:hypothetical protein [Actinocatenispora rupis]GID11047.1 hypothetical protein Aru02nite_19360 [Actinocatenispora rupis]
MTRNADADWDRWPVTTYLAENYRVVHPSDAAVIAAHSAYYRRIPAGSLDRTVELGAGPNLYPLMLASAASRHIDAVETSAANVAYLRAQVTGGADPSWAAFHDECRRHNPDLPDLPTALSRVRVRHADLTSAVGAGYDLASMHFVAESVTTDPAEFRALCGAFAAAVRPGGHLVAAFMNGMPTYSLGDGSTWPGLPVDADTVAEVFAPLTRECVVTVVPRDETLPAYGDDGMIVLHGRTRAHRT